MAWVKRLQRWTPVTAISQELVRFDMQKMQDPEIASITYQQGALVGYEVREYLLEKWGRKCAYCGSENVPLEIDHIHPRSKGGSDRVSNLILACIPCNQKKSNQDVVVYLAKLPERLKKILAQAKAPLKDAAAVNSTRWALYQRLKATGMDVETGSGGRTKWNRKRLSIPKAHCLDAACVGRGDALDHWQQQPVFAIKATGRGAYQRSRLTRHGFPRGYLTRQKRHFGFQTGDMVRALIPAGKHQGSYLARVAVRASGSFNLQTDSATIQGVSHKLCRGVQRGCGYGYQLLNSIHNSQGKERASSPS